MLRPMPPTTTATRMMTRIETGNAVSSHRRIRVRGQKQLTPNPVISVPRKESYRFAVAAMIVSSRGCSSMAERRFPDRRWGFDSLRPLQLRSPKPDSTRVESGFSPIFLFELDLRANASRLSRGKTGFHFSGSCSNSGFREFDRRHRAISFGLREPSVSGMRGLFRGQIAWN